MPVIIVKENSMEYEGNINATRGSGGGMLLEVFFPQQLAVGIPRGRRVKIRFQDGTTKNARVEGFLQLLYSSVAVFEIV